MGTEWGQERKEPRDLTVGMSLIMALPPFALSNSSEERECCRENITANIFLHGLIAA